MHDEIDLANVYNQLENDYIRVTEYLTAIERNHIYNADPEGFYNRIKERFYNAKTRNTPEQAARCIYLVKYNNNH